jgi:hypothetical protein
VRGALDCMSVGRHVWILKSFGEENEIYIINMVNSMKSLFLVFSPRTLFEIPRMFQVLNDKFVDIYKKTNY